MNGPGSVEYGPQYRAPETSLLTVSEIVAESDTRWTQGVGIESELAPLTPTEVEAKTQSICAVDEARAKDLTATYSSDSWEPFGVYHSAACSTWGIGRAGEVENRSQKALRLLYATESTAVEKVLFYNALGLDQPSIIDTPAPTTVTAAATHAVNAIALLEQKWSDDTSGAPALIHVRPNAFVVLAASQAIERRDNGQWYTPIGTPVYPARGLANTKPDGTAGAATSSWIYMTGRVQVRRSEVTAINAPVETINRQTNDIAVLQERIYLVNFANDLPRLAAESTFTYTF